MTRQRWASRWVWRWAIGIVTLLVPSSALAQTVTPVDGLVRITAVQVPLNTVLEELGRVTPLVLKIDPAVGERIVDVQLDPMPPTAALRAILQTLDINYALSGGTLGAPIRLLASVSSGPASASDRGGAPAGPNAPALPAETDASTSPVAEPDLSLAESRRDDEPESAIAETPEGTDAGVHTAISLDYLNRLLSGTPRAPRTGVIELPITGPDGKPLRYESEVPPTDSIPLPFIGPDGLPVSVPRPSPTR